MSISRTFGVALISLVLSSCLTGVDFDSIEPTCEQPSFDVPSRDQYCSGTYLGPRGAGSLDAASQLLGLDSRDGKVLVVAGKDHIPDSVVFAGYQLWMSDGPGADGVFDLDPSTATTHDLKAFDLSYVPPLYKARLVSAEHDFAMLNYFSALIPIVVRPGAAEFDPIGAVQRTPPREGDDFLFLDVASVQVDDRLLVFASTSDMIKVLNYESVVGSDLVEKVLPVISEEKYRLLDATLAALTPAEKLAVLKRSVDDPDNPLRGVVSEIGINTNCITSEACPAHDLSCLGPCAAIPASAVGLATAKRGEHVLLYAGGGGQIVLLEVHPDLPLTGLLEAVDTFVVTPDTGDYGLITVEMIVDDDLLVALMLGGKDVDKDSFDRGEIPASLVLIRLDQEGHMASLLSTTPLPPELTSNVYFSLQKNNDLVVVKSSVLTDTKVLNEQGELVTARVPGDGRVVVMDIGNPTSPRLLVQERFEHHDQFSVTGLASTETAEGMRPLVPTAEGLVTLEIRVEGDALKP